MEPLVILTLAMFPIACAAVPAVHALLVRYG